MKYTLSNSDSCEPARRACDKGCPERYTLSNSDSCEPARRACVGGCPERYMFASDIHGSSFYCKKMLKAYEEEGAKRLVLLGDILYHGPRNDLPVEYAPKEVIKMLNPLKNEIYAVRGNCEAEVDQMVLEFPVMADYCILAIGGKTIYATHGHIYSQNHLPPLKEGDILIHGHTHVPMAERRPGYILLNPGSVSLPKEGHVPTYAVLEGENFWIKDFDGNIVKQMSL